MLAVANVNEQDSFTHNGGGDFWALEPVETFPFDDCNVDRLMVRIDSAQAVESARLTSWLPM